MSIARSVLNFKVPENRKKDSKSNALCYPWSMKKSGKNFVHKVELAKQYVEEAKISFPVMEEGKLILLVHRMRFSFFSENGSDLFP
jgi:hypothetical protein